MNKIFNLKKKALKKFSTDLFNIARETGQPFKAVQVAAKEFSRMGLDTKQTLKRTKDAIILSRLAGTNIISSVHAINITINKFKL